MQADRSKSGMELAPKTEFISYDPPPVKGFRCFLKRAVIFIYIAALISCGVYFVLKESPDAYSVSAHGEESALPVLSITLGDGVTVLDIDKTRYLPASMSLTGSNIALDSQPLSIKGRGNSSWTFPKKPYTFKLDIETDLLGMGSAKKWNLLANYWDKTLIRNYLTLNLAAGMSLAYTPECEFVDLYINGVCKGNYLLTEKIELGKERIDESGGVLFELEQSYRHEGNCDNCFQTQSGAHILLKEPEETDISTADYLALHEESRVFLNELDASLRKGFDEYSKYIDLDSFVNWYILNETVKNYDSMFVTSCYCYRGEDGKMYMGPVWDYDTCYGNQAAATCGEPEGFHVDQAPWYQLLLQSPEFKEALRLRWSELRSTGVFDKFFENITACEKRIEVSRNNDEKLWPTAMSNTELRHENSLFSYTEEIDHLRKFISERTLWLDTQWCEEPRLDGILRSKFVTIIGGFPTILTVENYNRGTESYRKNMIAESRNMGIEAMDILGQLTDGEKTRIPLVMMEQYETAMTVLDIDPALSVVSADSLEVTTMAGVPAVIPDVTVYYSDGSTGQKAAIFESIPTENYAEPGSFTVRGTVGGIEVTATITVIEWQAEDGPGKNPGSRRRRDGQARPYN